MIILASRDEKELLERLRKIEGYERTGQYVEEARKLRSEIETLTIQRDRMKEQNDKERRELTHMIGLEKKRQEFEIAQAKAETTLKVQQENLAADKKRFGDEMGFQRERFEKEVGYLKDMMKDILDRLPNVNATLTLGGKGK